MVLSDLSVKRPVFATVLSLLLFAFGILSFSILPLRELPDVNPAIVSIETNYPGASAEIVQTKITQLIEDRISGIEGIRTIESNSVDGESRISMEFDLSRDVNEAANDVRDRVSRILGSLPEEADPPEIYKVDANENVIQWLNLSSTRLTSMELTDYAERYLVDQLATVNGVARIRLSGGRRPAVRIWIDRIELAARGLTVIDVERALRAGNVELPAGRIESREREFTVRVDRLYEKAEDFAQLVIHRGSDGYLVRLGDVANVVIGPEDERSDFRGNGEQMIGLGIVKQSTANTLEVAEAVLAKVDQLKGTLPEGTTIHASFDSSVFVAEAVKQVFQTLGIAGSLVILVIYLFLGTARAALIPAVTVPVCLVATFTLLALFGFSVNLLTLLALVLAIGIVVDDSIVVTENIYRRVEEGEAPLLAAYHGARQVAFAVIATTTVLVAVFVPIVFLEGIVGRIFAELAIAICGAVVISSVLALSLTPMMCSKLLRKPTKRNWLNRSLDSGFARLGQAYRAALAKWIHRPLLFAGGLVLTIALIAGIWRLLPTEFTPREDRGAFFVIMSAPEGSSFQYSQRYMRRIEKIMMPLVANGEANRILVRTPGNFSTGGAVNSGFVIAILTHWSERERSGQEIMSGLYGPFSQLPGVRAFPLMRQGFSRFGTGTPVRLVIGGSSYDEMARWRDIIVERARENPGLVNVDSDYKETKPHLRVVIDRDRAGDLGVSVESVGHTLETLLGSRRVTTYVDRGEEYDVIVQGREEDRLTPQDVSNIYVRSETGGELIPLSSLITLSDRADAGTLNRFNRLNAITISATLAPGYTLGEALAYLEQVVADELPEMAQIDYKGESREYKEAGSSLFFIFTLALLVVFLVLAAQFESFVHPFVILLTVPLAVLGALLGLFLIGGTLNVYSQIGIIMLIGIAAKNGILIVEFANQMRDAGLGFEDALIEASEKRLRPILMTAASTALGAVPLLLATGAGAESRMTIGIVVFSGVIVATGLTLFVVPVFYYLFGRFTRSPGAVARELQALERGSAE